MPATRKPCSGNWLGRKPNYNRSLTGCSPIPKNLSRPASEIRTLVMDGIQNLSALLREDTALARAELLKHSGEIAMIPHRNEKHRFYVAQGNWNLLGRDPVVDRGRQY